MTGSTQSAVDLAWLFHRIWPALGGIALAALAYLLWLCGVDLFKGDSTEIDDPTTGTVPLDVDVVALHPTARWAEHRRWVRES